MTPAGRKLAALMAAFVSSTCLASPTGGLVVGGSASISTVGGTTTIHQSTDRAIIRWDSFDVHSLEQVGFVQPTASSIAINRIMDTKASQIDGHLMANGNIVLINQNGIVFGSHARVDVGGLAAATSDIANPDAFLAGDSIQLTHTGKPDASIVNQGQITVGQAGLAGFVAPSMDNQGYITAKLGKVVLASGDISTIDFAGDGLIQLQTSDAVIKQQIHNGGVITADGGSIVITAAAGRNLVDNLINNQGTLQAKTYLNHKGHVAINGSTASVQNTGSITALGDTLNDGGDIAISASFVSLGGEVRADGRAGGTVSIDANRLSLAGLLSAQGVNGAGGTIDLRSLQSLETSTSVVDASGRTHGGTIRDIAQQQLLSSGTYRADSLLGNGGAVDITAWSTKLLTASVSASGLTGGGTIRLGGERGGGQGLPVDEVPNAYYTIMDRGTRLRASTTGRSGKGGTVVLWSDKETLALGSIWAQPGSLAGEGGFVEISSGDTPKFDATVVTGVGTRAGTVLLDPKNILIADFAFNPSAIILGYGFIGGRTSQNASLDTTDNFGWAVSLNGNRMAVGAPGDDAFNNTKSNTGAVYLFSYTDSTFSGGVLEGIIGDGYVGGKNYNITLENSDQFGWAVSLDGNRLAVGAPTDDGAANGLNNSGAVYLFSFSDSAFNGTNLEATLGYNYTGGKNINMAARMNSSDQFGGSVSLDGNRLAVGSFGDDGNANVKTDSGAVYLFTFTDSVFSGGVLQGTLGYGYTGGKNYDLTARLDVSDTFGSSVSLDGNQMLVGSPNDDGLTNAVSNAGAVYAFTFADATFSTPTLQSVIGSGYTGGKNLDLGTVLDAGDTFGTSVSLDANRFVIGSPLDDGYATTSGNSGAAYLFTSSNSTFDVLTSVGTIGYQYTNRSKDYDLNNSGNFGGSDALGQAVSLDGNRLVIGAYGDDGNGNTSNNTGAVYAITFDDAAFTNATLQGLTGSGYIQGKNYNITTLSDNDNGLGIAVSISGTRMAIGNFNDDGYNSLRPSSGAVYLFNFADTNYNGGTLQAIIGDGYTGGNNYSQLLRSNDNFGFAVSLDGNRLAVGARFQDGLINSASNAGAVYLYSFADSAFSGLALESTIGYGYTGGKNFDMTSYLNSNDNFGTSVSLKGTQLVIGSPSDDGNANALTDSGAAYLFTFTDTAFNGVALQGIIGRGYTGGKNVDNTLLDISDGFGYSVSLDTNRLAVGALNDDAFANALLNTGAVYLYSFTDGTFTGGVQQAVIGSGYTGGKNINLTLDNSDQFGSAVALSGNHLFAAAQLDDGVGNAQGDVGGIYHYTFTTSTFSGGALYGMIGWRYSGANDIDLRGYTSTSDSIGSGMSIDGTNLIVGSRLDDGYANTAGDAGSIYFFQFTDTTYTSGNLLGIAGAGYNQSILGKSINIFNTKDNDNFGTAVSLNGNRMAVGAPFDDGLNDTATDTGAVYLFSFTDATYGGGVLESIIGKGYTGGKNINMALDNSDLFGFSVSLDANRLAVGAYQDDGAANALSNAGAVYLFTFADSVFTGGALAATIGYNYTGGKNVNLSASLGSTDFFGYSVSLDGNRLAVGAIQDDGAANARTDSGAVYLFTFADSAFTGGALSATMGYNYAGGKNVNVSTLDTTDYYGSSVSLDGTMLAVGAQRDDGNANVRSDAGAVYLYTFSDSAFTGGTLQSRIGYGYTGGKNIDVSSLEASDYFGYSVALDANRLAVGIDRDDGFGNQGADAGAVQLYTFTDSVFSGGALQSTIGYRYTGGKNYDLANVFVSDSADRFSVVSLDGNRLLIGGYLDDPGQNAGNTGSVAMFTFADSAFTTPTLVGLAGNGYVGGGHNISLNPSQYASGDQYGNAVSLNANRMAIGVSNDDGFNDPLVNSGAVYLYSITGGNFDNIVLEGIMGVGYTGGKNVDLSAYLDRSDFFGTAVSLDGNRLAVGANRDDGLQNNVGDAGAVYLFTFSDSAFSGATLQSRIGYGYTGAKNYNLSAALGGSDLFGLSVSLDGNRLAVGAQRDDGNGNTKSDAGAVYLFTFADSTFSTPVLQGIIGNGYTGGKNYDVSSRLDVSDWFGTTISLDGNRLAVGAYRDDGALNDNADAGAVYLFTFSDATFSSPTLRSTIGYGYTGGNNVNITSLYTTDNFGYAVALDGTTLAISAPNDDGLATDTNTSANNYGAIYLYTFADTLFNTPTLDSMIGRSYTGGKNIDISAQNNAIFGNALSLDSGSLVVGAPASTDVSGQLGATGRVYIFRDSLSPVSDGATFASLGGSTIGITAASIAGLLSTPQNVTLQASNDITVASPIYVNNGGGAGGILTLQAGRSIFLNAAIVTDDADINILANENLATGVLNSQRQAGAAVITMGANGSIDAGAGNVFLRMDTGAGKTNFLAGDTTLGNITANAITVRYNSQTGNILTNGILTATGTGDAITLAAGANYTNNYGAGALVTPAGRWLVYADHDSYTNLNGLTADFSAYHCVYGGACSIVIPGAGNGALYEYGLHLLSVAVDTSRAYGDANPNNATLQSLYTYSGFLNGDTVSVLNVLPTATVASTATSTALAGTTHAITLSGGSDDFYDYYLVGGNLTINKRDITATWNSALTKIYGDVNPSVNTANFVYTGLANGENNSVITATANFGAVTAATGAGSYAVGANFTATNYNITNAPTTTLTINKRDITAAWSAALTRIYGDANPTVDTNNFIYTGFVNSDTNSAVTATADYGAITNTSNAGTYTNGVTGQFTSANYNITNAPTATLTINKRDITGVVQNDSRAYGSANPSWNWSQVTWSNLANSETGSVLDSLTVSAPTALATSNAGTSHSMTLTGFSDNNYNLTSYTPGTLTITKRDITAAWNAALTKIYGDANPLVNTGNFTYTNLANSDPNSAVTATADYGTTTAATGVGTYGVGVLFSSTNYNVTNAPATTLTINKRDVTAAWNAALTKTYGDANPLVNTNNFTYTNLANSDPNSAITATADFGTTTATTGVGGYAVGSVFSSANYNVTNTPATTLTINKRDITAAWNAALTKIYGDANPLVNTGNFTYTNLANSDPNSVITATADYGTTTASTGAGSYAVGAVFSAANYNITNSPTTTLTINKRDITAAWNAALTKIYGDANPLVNTNNFTYTNLANSDPNSAVTATADYGTTTAATGVGTYGVGVLFNSTNYNVTNAPATTLTINKRDITAAWNAVLTKTYGDANPLVNTNNFTYTNLANSDLNSAITATANYGTTTAATGAGTYAVGSAFSSANYNVTSAPATTLTINKAPLTLVVNDASRAVSMPDPIFSYVLAGLRNGDAASVLGGVVITSSATITSPTGVYNLTPTGGLATNYYVDTYVLGTLTIGINSLPSTVEQVFAAPLFTSAQAMNTVAPVGPYMDTESGDTNAGPRNGVSIIPDRMANETATIFHHAMIAITDTLVRHMEGLNNHRSVPAGTSSI